MESTYKHFTVTSLDNGNYSQMLAFDQNTAALDPRYLYIFGMPPYLAVAGAINGTNGPTDPYGFVKLAIPAPKSFILLKRPKRFC